MRRGHRQRRWAGSAAVLTVLVLAACTPSGSGGTVGAGAGKGPFPASMAALGDSITSGYGTCLVLADCQRNSWSTGDGAIVSSHYKRILGGDKAIKGHAANYAQAGAVAADLATQAQQAASTRPAYLTIMIGANDACRTRPEDMTSPAVFASQLDTALGRVKTLSPHTRILMVSIPDIYHLWEIGHGSKVARAVWAGRVCPSLLANPESELAVDVARRQQFRDRVDAYDAALALSCRNYGSLCRWDGGAVHGFEFSLSQVSALDFFHPNAEGENRIAKLTYPPSFDWGGNAAA
jgi:lysophospholipase L1-like esterase